MFGDALQEIVDSFIEAGIPATTEASQLQTPGILVTPGTITYAFQDPESFQAVIELYLITGNKPAPQALNDLQLLLTQVREIYQVAEAEPMTMTLQATGADSVPVLRTELLVRVDPDETN